MKIRLDHIITIFICWIFPACLFAQLPVRKVIDSVEIYIADSDYQRGLEYAKKRAALLLKKKDYLGFSKVVVQKAEIHNILNNNERALGLLFDALKVVKKRQEKIGEVILIRKIGAIYTRMLDYNAAKKHYYSAMNKARAIKNDSLIGGLNQPLFKLHVITKTDSAFFYLQKVMEYNRTLGTNEALTTAHNNYFRYYISTKEFAKAKTHIDSAVYYAKNTLSSEKKSIALTNLVYYLLVVENDLRKAKKIYQEIFQLSPNDTASTQVADLYHGYADILVQLGEFKEANYFLSKAVDIKEDNFAAKTISAVRDVELKYQIDQVEQQYRQKQKMLEQEESRKKKILSVFLALCILIIILFYFFHQNSKLKQKNKLREVESKIQQDIINATIDGQESERTKIASVLHDNISAMLSSAGLHLSAFIAGNQHPTEEIIKTRAILKETHDKVRDLSHELVPALLQRFGLIYALEDLCEKYSNSAITIHSNCIVPMQNRFSEEVEMKIYSIVSELLNNIIKHSHASEAWLEIEVQDGTFLISVVDNGIGFDATKPNHGEGFGLTQIRARINKMNGTLLITSKPNSGTTITIKLPVD